MNFRIGTTLAIAFSVSMLSGCAETMSPASYANYADNTYSLRKFDRAKIRVTAVNDVSHFDSGCRALGPIRTAGDRSIARFIQDSLNDEMKFAGVYSSDASTINLTGNLKAAEFSSMKGLTQGYWKFTLQLSNPGNGIDMVVDSEYPFVSGYNAEIACQNVSNALTPAVQHLINKVVTDSAFASLIGR